MSKRIFTGSGVPPAGKKHLSGRRDAACAGRMYSRHTRKSVKRRRGKMRCGKAEDAGGLPPAKDDNAVHAT
ncbi:MAG: hypothetical protein K2O45_14270, partial [Oscillospiraceae bacterium]|nr:hypothetical protein [Oscillospiraceae bacterium]